MSWFTWFPDTQSAMYLAVALIVAGIGLMKYQVDTRPKRRTAGNGSGVHGFPLVGAMMLLAGLAFTLSGSVSVTNAADPVLKFDELRETATPPATSPATQQKPSLDFAQLRTTDDDPKKTAEPFSVSSDGHTPPPPTNIYSLRGDVVYVFTMPNCAPCKALTDDVVKHPENYPRPVVFLKEPEWHPAWVAERAKTSGYPVIYAKTPAGVWSLFKGCPPDNFRTLVRELKT